MLNNIQGTNKTNKISIILSYFISLLVAIFVFLTGGTPSAFANLMYIPIATTSSINGRIHGAIHAAFSGLLLGPFMPTNNGLILEQSTLNWAIRLAIYIIISIIIGSFADFNRRSRTYITNLLTHDSVTELKNIEAIRRKDEITNTEKTIIALSVGEYEEILGFFGYDFAKEVVVNFSVLLKNILNKYKNVELFRYDGMEFIIVLDHENNMYNKEEIIESISSINRSTIRIDDIPIYIEVTMGMTTIEGGVGLLEGVRQSIVALRYAVEQGNKSEVFNTELDTHFKNLITMASEFKIALSKGQIKAAYQNIYNIKTGEIHGSELLTRWISKGKEIYNPSEFISVIEKTELINELSKHMIDIAIEKLKKERNKDLIVSINFSPKDFKDEVISYLLEKIEESRVNPRRLLIEITEDIFVNKQEVLGYLYKIRSQGVKIAIDDFGTGYSSYQYLTDLPIDVIKIDGSIIKKLEHNIVTRSLVKSIVEFSKANKIEMIAEGVENEEVLNICKDLGIDYTQGYYYHRPTLI